MTLLRAQNVILRADSALTCKQLNMSDVMQWAAQLTTCRVKFSLKLILIRPIDHKEKG